MKNDNLDKLIKDTYTEFNDEIDIHSHIEIPDFKSTMNRLQDSLKEKKNSSISTKRLAIAASFAVVVLISIFSFSIPQVTAFKFNKVKTVEKINGNNRELNINTSDNYGGNWEGSGQNNIVNNEGEQLEELPSLEKAKEYVPFKVLIPQYLPQGYKLSTVNFIKLDKGSVGIGQIYENDKKYEILVKQIIVLQGEEETINVNAQFKVENLSINNLKATSISDEKSFKQICWFSNSIKHEIKLPYGVGDNEVEKMIKSLK